MDERYIRCEREGRVVKNERLSDTSNEILYVGNSNFKPCVFEKKRKECCTINGMQKIGNIGATCWWCRFRSRAKCVRTGSFFVNINNLLCCGTLQKLTINDKLKIGKYILTTLILSSKSGETCWTVFFSFVQKFFCIFLFI